VIPTVSVVMPVYNGERFLAAALASICGQTYRDFEFLVIDDGSTDTTPLILADAARRDSRIRIITQPANAGVVAARNAGLQQAQGRFIAVMDSDDVAVPERLARQASHFEAHPDVAVLGGAVQLIDQDSVAGRIKAYPLEPDGEPARRSGAVSHVAGRADGKDLGASGEARERDCARRHHDAGN